MRKVSFITLFAAIIGITIMSSCSKDKTHSAPTITFSNGTSFEVNFATSDTTASFQATVSAEAGIETFTITEKKTSYQGGTTSGAYDAATTSSFKGETDKNYYFSEGYSAADFTNYSKFEYVFDVTDKDGQSYSITYTVTLYQSSAGAIDTYTAVLLGAQGSSTGSFYDVSANTVYTQINADANQSAIDFVHYYGSSNASTICAPNDPTVGGGSGNLTLCASWTTKNATLYGKVTGVTWANVTDDTEIVANESSATASIVSQLAVGDVVEFKNVDGKYGMFKVVSVETVNTGSITIDVKVQQ